MSSALYLPLKRAPRETRPHVALSHPIQASALAAVGKSAPHWQTRAKEEMRKVAAAFEIRVDEISGPGQSHRVIAARHEFCLRMHETGKYSSSEIGRLIDRHHTSILHAIKKGRERRQKLKIKTDAEPIPCPDLSGAWAI